MLCTEDVDGRRSVAHDPTTLTPALSELGAELEASAGADSSELEREFFQAAGSNYSDAEVASVLRSLRERKHEPYPIEHTFFTHHFDVSFRPKDIHAYLEKVIKCAKK